MARQTLLSHHANAFGVIHHIVNWLRLRSVRVSTPPNKKRWQALVTLIENCRKGDLEARATREVSLSSDLTSKKKLRLLKFAFSGQSGGAVAPGKKHVFFTPA